MTGASWKPSPKQLLKRCVIALFVGFLHFSAQLTSLSQPSNRYFRFWELSDGLALIVDIVLLALLAVAIGLLIDWTGLAWMKRLFHHLFLVALGSGVISNLPFVSRAFNHPALWQLFWIGLMALVGFSFGWRNSRLAHYAASACLIFSPLMILVFVPMFHWESWATPPEPMVIAQKPIENAHPIYFFVFDEWSYTRSMKEGDFLRTLSNLRALSAQSFVFHQNMSPFGNTYVSLPMLIYQTNEYQSLPRVVIRKDGEERVTAEDLSNPKQGTATSSTLKVRSLFDMARAHSYNTIMLGFYLPYRKILSNQVDYCRGYSYYPRGDTFPQKMLLGGLEAMRFWTDPVSLREFRQLEANAFISHWLDLLHSMQLDLDNVLGQTPNNTFAFIHWPVPHAPFIFNKDGSYRGAFPINFQRAMDDDQDRTMGTAEDYQRNLEYLDFLVGKIIGHLRAVGRFDNAMIIMTSDHSWRYESDPDYLIRPNAVRRVPLIIKLPYQKSAHHIRKEFAATQLKPLIQLALQGNNVEEKEILRLVEESTSQDLH